MSQTVCFSIKSSNAPPPGPDSSPSRRLQREANLDLHRLAARGGPRAEVLAAEELAVQLGLMQCAYARCGARVLCVRASLAANGLRVTRTLPKSVVKQSTNDTACART